MKSLGLVGFIAAIISIFLLAVPLVREHQRAQGASQLAKDCAKTAEVDIRGWVAKVAATRQEVENVTRERDDLRSQLTVIRAQNAKLAAQVREDEETRIPKITFPKY